LLSHRETPTTEKEINMSDSMQIYMIMDLSIGVINSDILTLEEALKILQESEDYAIMLQPDKDVNPSLKCDFCSSNYSTLWVSA